MAGGNTAADNITLNLGSGGANIASDYLTSEGGHAQFVKLGIGGDGSLNQITATNHIVRKGITLKGPIAMGSRLTISMSCDCFRTILQISRVVS